MSAVQYKGYTIKISEDSSPSNPRTEWDNLGTMVCFHSRYDLGDKDHGLKFRDYDSYDAMLRSIQKTQGPVIALPMYMYDHSGLTVSTTPFSCTYDSGRIGWIYVTKKKVCAEYECKRISPKTLDIVLANLKSEVKTYDDYLTGAVYGYEIVKPDGTDGDSCWGYYGSDHEQSGLLEAARGIVDLEIYHAIRTEGIQQELLLVA